MDEDSPNHRRFFDSPYESLVQKDVDGVVGADLYCRTGSCRWLGAASSPTPSPIRVLHTDADRSRPGSRQRRGLNEATAVMLAAADGVLDLPNIARRQRSLLDEHKSPAQVEVDLSADLRVGDSATWRTISPHRKPATGPSAQAR